MMVARLPLTESRRLAALRRTELLDTAPSPEFDDMTKLASFICGTPIALVSFVDEHRQWFKSRLGLDARETPRDVAFCAHAILGNDVFVVTDAREDERFADNPLVLGEPRVAFYAGAPLITAEGDALGTLCAIDHEPRTLSVAQKDALAALARQVVAQIELIERSREMTRRAEEMANVNELGELLQSCRNTDETNRVVAAYAERLFSASSGSLSLTRACRGQVETTVAWGVESVRDVFSPQDCWALRRGHPHRASSRDGVVCDHIHARPDSDYVCVPLVAHGETLGVFHLAEAGGVLSAAQVELAAHCAERIGLALANTRLRETLRSHAIRDPLTGLYNRRYLDESLEREVRRCLRHGRPLTLLALDIDHFKHFNDQFGHEGGDAILAALGAELAKRFRSDDIVCRSGGEEFIVVLPEATQESGAARALAVCAAVRSIAVSLRGQSLGSISVSVGISTLGPGREDARDLLLAADQALYCAKAEGRDRVVLAAPLVARPRASLGP